MEKQTKANINLSFNTVFNLADIRELTAGLTLDEQRQVVEQALLLIEGVYVHLPLKMAQYGIDPVQRLKLLLEKLNKLENETLFHKELLKIFTSLRDAHTNYYLPNPLSQFTAFLPFEIEECYIGSEPHYIVSKITPGYINHPTFIQGVGVTHWNGVPIRRAIESRSEETVGSNPAARRARALRTMSIRWLSHMLPPEEDWVVITYLGFRGQEDVRISWKALRVLPPPNALKRNDPGSEQALTTAMDNHMLVLQRARKTLFVPQAIVVEQKVEARLSTQSFNEAQANTLGYTRFPNNFEYNIVQTPNGKFGYLRIWSFFVDDPQALIYEIVRVLKLLPQEGIIVDVRDNPGGTIPAGEGLLQLFTDKKIKPQPLSFRNTKITHFLANSFTPFTDWKKSINLYLETGEIFSQGYPLFIDFVNKIGRVYHGKVVLITNALSYSTTDFLVAGFRDHNVGKILGVDTNTGAGGANIVTHEYLCNALKTSNMSPFKLLPKGIKMEVALRRSTRVGEETIGLPVEGFGIQPDAIHQITLNDLLNKNVDLISHASELLIQ